MKPCNHLVVLKGNNKIKRDKWRGMKLNISYIGNLNEELFGIANKKISYSDVIRLNYVSFHNEKLNSINKIKFSLKDFKQLDVKSNNQSRNKIGMFEQIMRNQLMSGIVRGGLRNKNINNFTNQNSLIGGDHYVPHKKHNFSLSCDSHLIKTKKYIKEQKKITNIESTRSNDMNKCESKKDNTKVHETKLIKSELIQEHEKIPKWKTIHVKKTRKIILPSIKYRSMEQEDC